MFIYESRIGKKNQTVVPMQIREVAGISEGDYLIWEVNDNGEIIVKPQKSKTDHLADLSKKIWGNVKSAETHLHKEKESW